MKQISEDRLSALARQMAYPRTPDLVDPIISRIRKPPIQVKFRRRLLQAGIIVLILAAIFGFIPPVRAAILDFIQIGIVRIFVPKDEEQPIQPENNSGGLPPANSDVSATAANSIPLFTQLDNIAGEMSLEQAQKQVEFPILLPSYPDQIGNPDWVFVQDTNGNMVVLIWLENHNPEVIRMSLHTIPEGSWVLEKFRPDIVQEALVNGERAVWTVGPYPLIMRNGKVEVIRMVSGNVLIWTNAELTFRLEANLPLGEAIQVAESLKPIDHVP